MRWLVVLLLAARLAWAEPARAQYEWRPLESWGFWAAMLMVQGTLGGIGAGTVIGLSSHRDAALFGGTWVAFAAGSIITAIAILVYRGQDFWRVDEYWQSRSPY